MKQYKYLFLPVLALAAGFAAASPETSIQVICDSLSKATPESLKSATIAVLPFGDRTGRGEQGLGSYVAEKIIQCLHGKGFTIVERDRLAAAAQEIALSQTGIIDEAGTLRAGQMLAAQSILTGTVSRIGGRTVVTARFVHVETGRIIASAEIFLREGELDKLTGDLLRERREISSYVFRSLLMPGWGQFYAGKPVGGAAWLAMGAGAAGTAVYFAVSSTNAETKYQNHIDYYLSAAFAQEASANPNAQSEYDAEKERLYARYSQEHDRMVISTAGAATIWLLNVADAVWAGHRSKVRIEHYFSGPVSSQTGIKLSYRF